MALPGDTQPIPHRPVHALQALYVMAVPKPHGCSCLRCSICLWLLSVDPGSPVPHALSRVTHEQFWPLALQAQVLGQVLGQLAAVAAAGRSVNAMGLQGAEVQGCLCSEHRRYGTGSAIKDTTAMCQQLTQARLAPQQR